MSVTRDETTSGVHFGTMAEARDGFKHLLDAAAEGVPATVQRAAGRAAVVDAERLRYFLFTLTASQAQVIPEEDGGWSVVIPGLPVAADGSSLDEALDQMVIALRVYADDWIDHLHTAPNHQNNWGLVQLTVLSSDGQLRAWLQR